MALAATCVWSISALVWVCDHFCPCNCSHTVFDQFLRSFLWVCVCVCVCAHFCPCLIIFLTNLISSHGWRKECEIGLTIWEKPWPDNYWSDQNFEYIRLWPQMAKFLVRPRSEWSDRFRRPWQLFGTFDHFCPCLIICWRTLLAAVWHVVTVITPIHNWQGVAQLRDNWA